MNYTVEIKGHTLEYIDDGHIYLVDGVMVPSITQLLKRKFPDMYKFVPQGVLEKASEEGTRVHELIEEYCKGEIVEDSKEVNNFAFLKKKYGFEVLENEIPVILFDGDTPIAAGRLDMVLEMNGKLVGADIKRTYKLNKDYVALQLNMYRIAYRQCYDREWEELRAVHLREDTRRFIKLPINEEYTWEVLHELCEQGSSDSDD